MAHRSAGRGSAPKDARARISANRLGCWWSQTGSNRRPPACKAGALPTELWPLRVEGRKKPEVRSQRRSAPLDSDFWLPVSESLTMVGLGRLELPTSRLSGVRSNRLSYRPDAFAVASCLKKEKRRRRNPALSLDPVRFLRPVRCLGRADMASVRAHP